MPSTSPAAIRVTTSARSANRSRRHTAAREAGERAAAEVEHVELHLMRDVGQGQAGDDGPRQGQLRDQESARPPRHPRRLRTGRPAAARASAREACDPVPSRSAAAPGDARWADDRGCRINGQVEKLLSNVSGRRGGPPHLVGSRSSPVIASTAMSKTSASRPTPPTRRARTLCWLARSASSRRRPDRRRTAGPRAGPRGPAQRLPGPGLRAPRDVSRLEPPRARTGPASRPRPSAPADYVGPGPRRSRCATPTPNMRRPYPVGQVAPGRAAGPPRAAAEASSRSMPSERPSRPMATKRLRRTASRWSFSENSSRR